MLREANQHLAERKKEQAASAAVRPRSYRVAPNVGFVDAREMRRSSGTGTRQSAPRRRAKYKVCERKPPVPVPFGKAQPSLKCFSIFGEEL